MRLYWKYLLIHIKSQMQYKASFFMTLLGQFLVSFTALLGLWFMFLRFNQVQGFSFEEVLLCFASVLMAFALAESFARGFDIFPRHIRTGSFDRILLRPRRVIPQILASEIELTRLGRFIQALIVFVYAIPHSGISWSWDKILVLSLMVACGCVLNFCLFLIYASFSFFTIEGLEFINIFTDGNREFGRYPYSIYGKEVLRLVTYIIPLALVQYYPLLYLMGREKSVFYLLSPLLSLLFFLPAWAFWSFGLRKYQSTGS